MVDSRHIASCKIDRHLSTKYRPILNWHLVHYRTAHLELDDSQTTNWNINF